MSLPDILCHAHGDIPKISVESLTARAIEALPACLADPGETEAILLPDFDEIEVSLISDEAIASVHGKFMNDPSPTDVITFHHGEILVSAETAVRCSAEHGHPPEREALLYVIHGLLHLNGHDDLSEPARSKMHAAQERILDRVWPLR